MSHIVEIDLQDNLLYKWSELAVLTTSIPGLKSLQLHGNKFQLLTEDIVLHQLPPAPCFRNITILALNACNIKSWSSMVRMLCSLIQVEAKKKGVFIFNAHLSSF